MSSGILVMLLFPPQAGLVTRLGGCNGVKPVGMLEEAGRYTKHLRTNLLEARELDYVSAQAGPEHLLGRRHTHGHSHALAQGTGGRFHAGGPVNLWMTGSAAAQLAEIEQVVQLHITYQVEHAVQKGRL